MGEANRYLGWGYVWGGASPSRGFDCSGLVYVIYRPWLPDFPRTAAAQYAYGAQVQGELQPGDIVCFQNTYRWGISHVGIYLGRRLFIHAVGVPWGVTISSLDHYYQAHYAGATRPLDYLGGSP